MPCNTLVDVGFLCVSCFIRLWIGCCLHESDGGQFLGKSAPAEVVRDICYWLARAYVSSYHIPGECALLSDKSGLRLLGNPV